MDKAEVVSQIFDLLKSRFARMRAAAAEAQAAATDESSKAENKYDTRGLEASYLAAGQAEQVEELAVAVQLFGSLQLPKFAEGDPVAAGALVEAELDGDLVYYLLAPGAGGVTCEYLGCELTVLAPGSPLREKLLGHVAGDVLDDPALVILEVT